MSQEGMRRALFTREGLASTRLDRDQTINLGPPPGLGDRLRELGVEAAILATGRDAGLWLTALESLAAQADELERERAQWRDRIKRVRAEAYTWTDGTGRQTNGDLLWCAKRIRFALDG